jgi:hypothetical protein
MTVSDLIQYFGDGDMFPDPKQEVKFVFSPDGEMSSKKLDIRFATVPGKGDAIVELNPTSKRKFMFSLKFEANPVIEAESFEEAEKLAAALMDHRAVVDTCTGDGDDDFVAQEPCLLEEVKE